MFYWDLFGAFSWKIAEFNKQLKIIEYKNNKYSERQQKKKDKQISKRKNNANGIN